MIDPWFYERTYDGWEIRDENRLLVALVPDASHEREHDARRIAKSRDLETRTSPPRRGRSRPGPPPSAPPT
jgi:hypothetical protein